MAALLLLFLLQANAGRYDENAALAGPVIIPDLQFPKNVWALGVRLWALTRLSAPG
jgi:hypothetical protein